MIEQATKVAADVFTGHDQWEASLGRYVRLFSDIEFASVWIIRNLAPADQLEKLCDAAFDSRSQKAKDLINKYCSTRNEELGKAWVKFFETAIHHARTVRNKVLHNPLMVSLYECTRTGELSARLEMPLLRRDGQYVTYEQLQQHLADLDTLYEEWRRLWTETTQLAFREPKDGPSEK